MMHSMRWRVGVMTAALGVGLAVGASAQYAGWTIPEGAKDEKSPVKAAAVADAVKKGKALFASNCVRCHGPLGKGDGPDSQSAADLTDEYRTELNPEGILYYKVWNGHASDMPAFKSTLMKDDVWSLVEYLKVLRTPAK